MITIGMNYRILPGKESSFERVFTNVLKDLNHIEGHTRSALYKNIHDVQSYLIVSEWHSEEVFHTFIHSGKFKSIVNWGEENILADKPIHTIYRG